MLRHVTRTVRRVAGFAAAAVLTVVAAGAGASAPLSEPIPTAGAAVVAAGPDETPRFPLLGRKANGHLYDYEPIGTGGWHSAVDMGGGFGEAAAIVQANVSDNGTGNDLYFRQGETLYYTAERGNDTKMIGNGWDRYNLLVSVGNMGGTTQPDLIARDADGAIWLYQGKANGTLATKLKIGNSGWNGMDQLAGRGDYTGDGKADLVARSTSGTLYIYPGTGTATEDGAFSSRITVGTGWGGYKALVSTGDHDGDGKTDLIASDEAGALWLFEGTGKASAPFAARVKIGNSGWTAFNALF